MSLEEKILSKAHDIFIKKGIRNATMDELAQSLGMSKRTLYEHFSDKKTLVFDEAKRFSAFMKHQTEGIINDADNVIQGVTRVMSYVKDMLNVVSPLYFMDMKRYYPEAYELVSRNKSTRRGDVTLYLVKRGVEEGVLKAHINKDLVEYFFTSVVLNDHRTMAQVDNLRHGDFERDVLFAYMLGIATEKGRALIEEEQDDYFSAMPQYGQELPICEF